MSRAGRFLILLLCSSVSLAAESLSLKPEIQSPEARVFPAAALQRLSREALSNTAEGRRRGRERLRALLPRRPYAFGPGCPLLGRPELAAPGIIVFSIECASDLPSIELSLAGANSPKALPGSRQSFVATAELLRVDLDLSGRLSWSWQIQRIGYSNPFMEALRRNHPTLSEVELRRDAVVEQSGGALLLAIAAAQADGAYRAARDLHADWAAIVAPGAWLQIAAECPLTVVDPPRREEGRDVFRSRWRLPCRPGERIELLIDGPSFRNQQMAALSVGQEWRGKLRLAAADRAGEGLQLKWDAIRLEGPVR